MPEVLDVWFDAGSMPYAQWHYPFENNLETKKQFPADFIVEAIEQTRLWFYVLHVLAVALTRQDIGLGQNKPAFTHAIGAGIIFDEQGRKLSKKLNNYPEIEPTVQRYGADVLRLYLLSSSTLGEPYRFSEKELVQMQRQVYMTFWNVYSFFVRYARVHAWETQNSKLKTQNLLDDWILARTKKLERDVHAAMDEYRVDRAARSFVPFVDDLSNWYVRRSRDRFQHGASEEECDTAFATLHTVLVKVITLLAPFMPFVTEEMYKNLVGKESVHLENLVKTEHLSSDDEKLLTDMASVREIVSEGLAIRAKAGVKVRQPLSRLMVVGHAIDEKLATMVCEEVNVRSLDFIESISVGEGIVASSEEARVRVALDTRLTPELKREGLAREIIRRGQVLRREAGYALDDRITLVCATGGEELTQVLTEHREFILDALQADEVVEQADSEDAAVDVTLEGEQLHVGVLRG
jgi:isoleucyl-tRNA synthetase